MNIPLNLETIATSIIISAVVFLGSAMFRSIRALDKLTNIIESQQPPGVLGRLHDVEKELSELRDWCLKKGYDRRDESK
jgi:hypothetical protein